MMTYVNLIILSAPIFTLPILLLDKPSSFLLKIGLFCSAITILSLVFGIYGRFTSGLLISQFLENFDVSHRNFLSERIYALGLFSSWATSYPLMLLFKKNLHILRANSFIGNVIFTTIYFYSLHIFSSAIGILLVWIFVK
jgi:hypothetical protein